MNKAPWHAPLKRVSRQDLYPDGILEFRERALNQRLIDKYYDQLSSELNAQIIELQRANSSKPRE